MVGEWSIAIIASDGSTIITERRSNYERALMLVKAFNASRQPGATLKVHAPASATDEQRQELIANGADPVWEPPPSN